MVTTKKSVTFPVFLLLLLLLLFFDVVVLSIFWNELFDRIKYYYDISVVLRTKKNELSDRIRY